MKHSRLLLIVLLLLGPKGWSFCGFSSLHQENPSQLFHLANTFIGHSYNVIPQSELGQAPYNAVVKIATYDKTGKPGINCTGFITNNPHIVITDAHCLFKTNNLDETVFDPETLRAERWPNIFAFAGLHDNKSKEYRKLKPPCALGTDDPDADAKDDYAVFYVDQPFKGVSPFEIEPPDRLPTSCENDLNEVEYLPDWDSQDNLYKFTHCRREKSYEEIYNRNFQTKLIGNDCGSGSGASGSPIYCKASVGGHTHRYLYAMASTGNGKRELGHAKYNVQFSADTVNMAVPVDRILKGVNACLKKHGLPQMKSKSRVPRNSGSVANFNYLH